MGFYLNKVSQRGNRFIMLKVVVLFLSLVSVFAEPTTYFKEDFSAGNWEDRWVQSKTKNDFGKWALSAGKFYNDAEKDVGLQTSQDARFYAVSSKFDKFSNEGKDLVIQFSVKHEQNIDCGGGYVKVFPSTVDISEMNGDSPYNIMFGPDICGPGTKKVHVIFNYKGKNLLIKKDIRCKDDELTHVYTLIVKSDNTYTVKIDNKDVKSGSLEEDWDFLAPKEIPDPEAKKPEDWVDTEMMDDPEDKKPEDWDKPQYINDPDAEMPDDWDEETDGEWEPSQIDNPEYKGEWKPKQIKNPAYKGPWVHPQIANPDYEADDQLYKYSDFGSIGFDLWQVKSGTVFDNVLITDDVKAAEEAYTAIEKLAEVEKKMKEEFDDAERKKEEEEAAKNAGKDEDEDLDDDEMEEVEEDEEDEPAEEPATDAATEAPAKEVKDEL